MLREVLAAGIAFSSGLLISMGVTSVLLAVSLVPRLAGRSNTASKIFLYENVLTIGLLLGNLWITFGDYVKKTFGIGAVLPGIPGEAFSLIYGLLTGIFVGCIAIALAEMLDAIPIFARRGNIKKEINVAILMMALGKTVGSLIMFYNRWMI